jgi:hypothetical protein
MAALCLSALPWLHLKVAFVSVALGGFALARLRSRPRRAFFLTALLMAAAYLGYSWSVFGRLSPLARYGSHVPTPMAGMTPGRTLVGIFLDGGFGLLVYAPVFVLGLAGLPRLLGRGKDRWAWGLATVAVLVPVLGWKNWWGFSPPARFLVPLVPVLAVAMAARRSDGPPVGLARWRGPLLVSGLGLALLMSAEPRQMRMINNRDGPIAVFELLKGETSLSRYLPRLTSRRGSERPPWKPPPAEGRVAFVWLAALGVLLTLDRLARSRRHVDRAFRGLSLPLGLLLLLTVAVDGWARAASPGERPRATTGPRTRPERRGAGRVLAAPPAHWAMGGGSGAGETLDAPHVGT